MGFISKVTIASILYMINSSAIAKPLDEESWALKLVNYFEMYCYQTGADFSRTTSMADALEMQEIPRDKLIGMMPLNDIEDGKGYLLEHDEVSQQGILMMAVSGLDACSVTGSNIEHGDVLEYMSREYHLLEFFKGDTGLQINTLYIPGGNSEAVEEAHEKGVISIMHSKPNAISNGITIGYLPPRTTQVVYQ